MNEQENLDHELAKEIRDAQWEVEYHEKRIVLARRKLALLVRMEAE